MVGIVISPDGALHYSVDVNSTIHRRHINQMRSFTPSGIPSTVSGNENLSTTILPRQITTKLPVNQQQLAATSQQQHTASPVTQKSETPLSTPAGPSEGLPSSCTVDATPVVPRRSSRTRHFSDRNAP